jgi:hypothetical protein
MLPRTTNSEHKTTTRPERQEHDAIARTDKTRRMHCTRAASLQSGLRSTQAQAAGVRRRAAQPSGCFLSPRGSFARPPARSSPQAVMETGSACGASAAAAVSLARSSDTLAARLSFAAGDTPRSPMMDSSTASQRRLFSIATPPATGTDESLEKATWMERDGSDRIGAAAA